MPGSHRQGKLDIAALVKRAGSERLPDAVPLICAAGGVAICNRQRRQRFPSEVPYVYRPFAGREEDFRWTPQAKAGLVNYNLLDLGI